MMFPKFDKAGRGDTMGGEAIGHPGVPGRKQPVLSDANIWILPGFANNPVLFGCGGPFSGGKMTLREGMSGYTGR